MARSRSQPRSRLTRWVVVVPGICTLFLAEKVVPNGGRWLAAQLANAIKFRTVEAAIAAALETAARRLTGLYVLEGLGVFTGRPAKVTD